MNVYLPLVTQRYDPRRGVAHTYGHPEDLDRLGVAWWYDWSCGATRDPRYVPMLKGPGEDQLSLTYGGPILFLNEPDGVGALPGGLESALRVYRQVVQQHPGCPLVAGNVTQYGLPWLLAFREGLVKMGLPLPHAWGMHGYLQPGQAPADLCATWSAAHAQLGGRFWITEFNDTQGNPENLRQLCEWIQAQPWIERFAPFCSRTLGGESWLPAHWTVALINAAGQLTPLGEQYLAE